MSETCEKRVYWGSRDVSGRACGRPITVEGARLCNVHLGALKRSEEADRKRSEKLERELARLHERDALRRDGLVLRALVAGGHVDAETVERVRAEVAR